MIESRLPERKAEFVRDRDELLRRVADFNAIIESIDRAIAPRQEEDHHGERPQEPPQEPPQPAKDEYVTKDTGDAIVSYLTARPTFKVSHTKLEQHLTIGGAQVHDRGRGVKGRLHNIGLTIPQLAKQYQRRPPLVGYSKVTFPGTKRVDPDKSLVWLADSARYIHPKRNQQKQKQVV